VMDARTRFGLVMPRPLCILEAPVPL
jgi:hypothetical protein